MNLQDAVTNSPAGRGRRFITWLVVPAAAALATAIYVSLPLQSKPVSQAASSQADAQRVAVRPAHAAAGTGQGTWMPAPAANAAEGNVFDMNY